MTDVFKNRRTHQKGEDAERIRRLEPLFLGHVVNSAMTVIARWRAIEVYRKVYFETAHPAVSFIYAKYYQNNAQIKEELIMSIFKGAGVAIVTPMKSGLEVNYDKLAELLEEQIAGGTDAIIICGTTGESATMSEEEHSKVIRFAIERVNHRIPVIAGTGSNSTRTAIQLSQEAAKDGADGLLLVTPYYNKATQNGLIAHYTQICNAVDIPAILYNVPSRTGCAIQPATVAHLVKNVDNIVGIKEASGDISIGAKIMHLCDGNIDLYSGNDDQVVPLLSLGGIGVISVLSNVAPTYVHDMVTKYLSGDTEGSCKMQLDALPLCDALFCEVNPIPVKAALNMMGKEVGPLRSPLTELEDQHKELLKKAMTGFGLL